MNKREWQIEMANRFAKRDNDIEELDTRSYLIGRYDSTKTLTDEEIWELHQEHIDEVTCGHSMKTVGFIEFARAILKKAQEK